MITTFYGPAPRLRIYIHPGQFGSGLGRIVTGRFNVGHAVQRLRARLDGILFGTVVFTPLARTGIYLCLNALIKPGQNVILSPYTIALLIWSNARRIVAETHLEIAP
jgi:hypothetical protein